MSSRTLGHYQILAKIGAGGMGEVYRAHDESLDRDVAIKVLPAESFRDANARARLLREARTASQLNHPNICTIHEVGEADGQAYIAMELVEGQPLSARLEAVALPAEEVLRYGLQLAEALGHAHERSVVHRDFKSANVILTPEGRAKVLDFGLAKRVTGEELDEVTRSQASLTQPGALVGTLAYMPPEQLRGQPADARSDIWALGVVLYEMATGARPFQGQTGFELSSAILNQRPAALPAKVPLELKAVIERCLEKEPAQRYQRAGEVRAAIEAIQSGTAAPWAGWRYMLGRAIPQVKEWPRWLQRIVLVLVILIVANTVYVGGKRTFVDMLDGFRAGWEAGSKGTANAPKIESLAVLPLENLSGDPEQEYFADGMTESLITDLGRLTGLKRVIARGSVMRYKGTKKPLSEIARELKVDALITGSVLRSGNRVRLTAQLVNPENEEQLWSERYERDLRDVLSLQNELTRAIAGEIRLKLAPEEEKRLATARTVNPEAYDAYLKGRFHWQKLTAKELDTAESYFRLALEKDPNYALAYYGIGTVWGLRCNMGVMQCTEAIPKWKEAVLKGVGLEPTLPEAQAHLAGIKLYVDWDWQAAEKELRRAIELNPSDPVLRVWYGEYLVYIAGRADEGVEEARRGLELDPHNSTQQVWLAQALVGARRYDEAIAYLQQVLQADPSAPMGSGTLQGAYAAKGMYDEAMTLWRESLARGRDKELAEAVERGYAQGGYQGAMRARAELAVRRSQHRYVAPTSIAGFYAAAGEKELALDWLEKGYEQRDMQIVRIKGTPRWDTLRDHPRFQALLKKMNFPQ